MGLFDTICGILSNLSESVNNKQQQMSDIQQRAYREAQRDISDKSDNELREIITSGKSTAKDYGLRQAALEEAAKRKEQKKKKKD